MKQADSSHSTTERKPRRPPLETSTRHASKPTASPILAMAEYLAANLDRVNAYDALSTGMATGKIAYGTTKPERADEWMRAAEATDQAWRHAILSSQPATLADAAVLSVLAAVELDSLNCSAPIEGDDYKHTVSMLYTAVGALSWVLTRHCRDKLPEAFVERFAHSVDLCHKHGPAIDDLPITSREG